MKTLQTFFLIFFFFSIQSIYAQAPQTIPYQAVARDNAGNPITNQVVSLRFTIHDATTGGAVVYKETQSKTTNAFGLFTANIGEGTVVSGTFANINWGGGSKFMQVEMDASGGFAYTDMGTQQMLSVPYALSAANGNWTKTGNNISNANSGNVGIGTNAPQYITDIFVPGNTSGTGLNIHTNLAGTGTGYLRFTNTSNNDNTGNFSSYIGGERNINTGHSLVFGTALLGSIPIERIRILGNGNVGIGTTTPTTAKLEVAGQVKITGGTPGEGKVLTSDATGLANWQLVKTYDANYSFVGMGCQSWMSKNLDVATYRNGDPIPKVTVNATWAALTTGAYCYYNNDSATYAATYGKLYNWYAVNDPRGLAPEGWHIPTDFEWTILENALGGSSVAGGAMKETGISHWTSPNTSATNISGFVGLPGGQRGAFGAFFNLGNFGYWWSSTESNPGGAWARFLSHNNGVSGRDSDGWDSGYSVRCLRD